MLLRTMLKNSRAFSTLQPKIRFQNGQLIPSLEERQEFMAIFHNILKQLTDLDPKNEIQILSERHGKLLNYNVSNGKKNRRFAVVLTYKLLEDPELLTPENKRLAYIMGWCVEMLQASYVIADDLMDNSKMRRGTLCWYKNPEVGKNAINDSMLLKNGIFYLLKLNLSKHKCYIPAIKLFDNVGLKSTLGQALDSLSQVDGKPNLDAYTMERYNAIASYKLAYNLVILPITLAMYLANKFDPELHKQTKTLLLQMRHFYQVQNDFLDCYGNFSLTGKIGNDIEEGKCSWLVVVALQKATSAQKQILVDIVENLHYNTYLKLIYITFLACCLLQYLVDWLTTMENQILNVFK